MIGVKLRISANSTASERICPSPSCLSSRRWRFFSSGGVISRFTVTRPLPVMRVVQARRMLSGQRRRSAKSASASLRGAS